MPRTHLDKMTTPKKDVVKAILLERKQAFHLTNAQLAAVLGVSPRTFTGLMRKHTNQWQLEQILTLSKHLSIPIDELRCCVSYTTL